ncbi:hypothetical protein GN244_ATG10681 [Phytophthora infestans]|uniref:Uncharacterized protein n=1 Tax=Phytophthora infestans TaxID=4787 RepID=A0A833SRX8_PHYIN|nr:hypothetical protein GN244_ATG10681 [Phytophthora infestans]KAF4142832.1 hypothetical protein GN958_ATG07969 [Phytophthora infestans]
MTVNLSSVANRQYKELLLIAGCVLLWVVTEPLRSVALGLFTVSGLFVYKWVKLSKEGLLRYRKYVRSAVVQEQPLFKKWWKIFEAVAATPMVVLVEHGEYKRRLGRVIYKWIGAFHAYWCGFLPESLRNGQLGVAKYWNGLNAE